ncbi:class I SAM-dependent methyltransferase [Sabulilitoribacter multivorans]|uniref:Class I SAM-dependent methyltransferase n=1 Tax=Flaviramulus multivorans TaxID=1304750 RepID=A0ABS9IHT6_9FLAO|nr:class I SAM-dependent methyltransferase [Flaviramulus multivorans]MCF7560133.1 class I SAM-dependent methyltransferase [Flaviramulus multivorans]
MNPLILNTEIQEFINDNLNTDISSLLLKGTSFLEVSTKDIIEQIEAKKRCEKKLPTWFNTKNIYYPNKLNIEQTSSEITAKYKSQLIEGNSIIDLTGGFGVDAYFFSKQFKTVKHCEINEGLSHIVAHNYKQLQTKNITTIATDGIEYILLSKNKYDWIYIDPSRRHDTKGKVFFLKDCLPNVPEHIDLLFNHSNNILIKTSPLLDLSIGIDELKHVKAIHVVAVNNEVKELLWVLEKEFDSSIQIETVNIKNDDIQQFHFTLNNKKNSESKYSKPLTYLYEPNSAILKAGAFDEVSNQLNVFKLHKHSHLYTSENLVEFPGRIFRIERVIPYNKKTLKKAGITKANITTRNFPETVQQIRKKNNIKDGGHAYLFFTTNHHDEKIVIVTSKVL